MRYILGEIFTRAMNLDQSSQPSCYSFHELDESYKEIIFKEFDRHIERMSPDDIIDFLAGGGGGGVPRHHDEEWEGYTWETHRAVSQYIWELIEYICSRVHRSYEVVVEREDHFRRKCEYPTFGIQELIHDTQDYWLPPEILVHKIHSE